MKGKFGPKTLKTVAAAAGITAMVLLPTGCATAAGGGGGAGIGTGGLGGSTGGLVGGITGALGL
ncbi:Mycobacterium numidiamassiliense ORFan [Mycobacterium numidiamassiliense]|jgi:hypothetical protein|uniref:Mycobacterium numidiamassiliense ORFan n=1 Tax=Mycobacterium numidiamassiliense TaxID=1841861 RepID=A0A2U3P2N3_9MYCO|nr:hypothetical protein [Mycobacterium numidiamassiliense]SPM38004.1 Mycobacterium numidiamassiliense ORFan [Mycobacterium numidiamassiliense]